MWLVVHLPASESIKGTCLYAVANSANSYGYLQLSVFFFVDPVQKGTVAFVSIVLAKAFSGLKLEQKFFWTINNARFKKNLCLVLIFCYTDSVKHSVQLQFRILQCDTDFIIFYIWHLIYRTELVYEYQHSLYSNIGETAFIAHLTT